MNITEARTECERWLVELSYTATNPDIVYTDDKERAATITVTISYVLTGGQLGIEPGYVVLGLSAIDASVPQEEGGK